jgi:hypothetical protein
LTVLGELKVLCSFTCKLFALANKVYMFVNLVFMLSFQVFRKGRNSVEISHTCSHCFWR